MDKMIACCGIDCSKCNAYLATANNDDALREKTAEEWGKMYKVQELKAEHINCKGCGSDLLFSHCHECNIRKCNIENETHNCSECDSYACEKINGFFEFAPELKNVLDGLRDK